MSTTPEKHDVFISFRGEDTRETFTSHLHHALCNEHIAAYIDDNLVKGDDIGTALAQAIQDSHISLVIISENYASSKWCLNELLKILECRKLHGQVVIPVFYNTDPSDVRNQTGSFREVFIKYDREAMENDSFADTVSQWKTALAEAANIPGWHSRSRAYKDDSQVIQSIVKDVWQKLALMYPNELKGIVHTYGTSENVELSLDNFSRIGIWGMGGIGKTTIAREMFAKHFAHFDSACFLESVSEGSKNLGLQYLRDKLLGDLLRKPITASDVHGLHTFIKRRLSGKKVFIVLDDVDSAEQLDYLCEELDELGPNSWLIITARDRQVFGERVAEIHNVQQWKSEESLRLFSLGAFKQSQPKEGYQLLSERAVAYAGGVPLALKVLGAHFYNRNAEFWEDQLKYLENKGESLPGIQQVLKVSYNGVTVREKEMFLDIAFFFKGEDRDFTTTILDACGFNATSGIDILKDKALITISNNNIIQMHDLLQKMAFDIVRNKNDRAVRDPRKRSRLRDIEEVCDVLNNSRGTQKVEGITFDLSQKADLHFRADTFNMMTKLRILRLNLPLSKERLATIYLPEDMLPFSHKLRYLEWNGYPLKSLPHLFRAKFLVEIHFPHSNVEYLWHGMQELVNLEGIDLSESKQLMKLPDLSGATKLKRLYLSGCESLCEVQPSVFSKDTLTTLLVDRCQKLKSLVSEKHLTLLEKIDVNGCSSLREFSLSSDSIQELDLSNTGIEILHSSIGRLSILWRLNLEGLRLTNLPKELSCLRSLTMLHLSNCNVVTKSKLEALFDGLESLSKLYLKYCYKLSELPENIGSLSSLYELRLDGCSVKTLPVSIKNLLKLQILYIDNCRELGCLPELPPCIKQLHANNCISLVNVSTLKTFSESMKGACKHISFKNGMRMKLDDNIMEDVTLTMMSAAFHNKVLRDEYASYNKAEVCLPGRRVPRQFKFRTTDSSSINIGTPHLSDSLGFIFSVVVSPTYGMKEHGKGAIIKCQCYWEDQSRTMSGYQATITDFSSDHVFVWYDQYDCDFIVCNNEPKIIEFSVTTVTGECHDFYSLKECGVCPIYFSDFPRFKATMNLDKDLERSMELEVSRKLESDLDDSIQFESETTERYDEREGNDIESIERCDEMESIDQCIQMQNQDLDLNKKCGCSYECVIGPLRYLWRLICT